MIIAEGLLQQAQKLNEANEYNKVIELLTDEVLQKYNEANLYAEKANAFYGIGRFYEHLEKYDDAIQAYNKAKKYNPKSAEIFNSLGIAYKALREYDEAIKAYEKAIKIDPTFAYPYNGLGSIYTETKKYDAAISAFNKALELNPLFTNVYYNKATVYYNLQNYENAIEDYEKYIDLTQNSSDIFTQYAKEKLAELKLNENFDYYGISTLIDKIENLLLCKDSYVTHYTGFSAAKRLILEKSLFRLSEGAFLNDTSEGRELFDFLKLHEFGRQLLNDSEIKPFRQKPFVGSFVAATKHDDLTLWRMYGKENKEEAKGCAITIDTYGLLYHLKKRLNINNIITDDNMENIGFYNIAYRTYENRFIIPGRSDIENRLNKSMLELQEKVRYFVENIKNETENRTLINGLANMLNRIAFLFKNAGYKDEQELRLVVKKGIGFDKKIIFDSDPPRVYIELVDLTPIIKKITFGPKVEQRDEWVSVFYYSFEKDGHQPDIYISHLPFK